MEPYSEAAFEASIVAHLVKQGGWAEGRPDAYDRRMALLPADVLGFVAETQAKAWEKVRDLHGDKLPAVFLEALCKELAQQGSLAVLRRGFKFYGQSFRLAGFAPAHGLNPDVLARYAANRLTVVRQVRYDPSSEHSLDLVLFLNGIPVATAELKNPMTGQSAVVHARDQYRFGRNPKAPIFRFKERALVHFAVDPDEVWMTTRLEGADTVFLPFNKGHGTAAGNPPAEGRHRTHYLWEEVWGRDSFLELVERFLLVQVKETETPEGKKVRAETVVFPRYHQLDCVRELEAAARKSGAGTNYLVQHSAGSGKSNTIAWTAHRLASLHGPDDKPVYDCVVVLTDRRVIDQQLQDAIYQIEHKRGVVEKIESGTVKSARLAQALEAGASIVVCTIHSFGFVQDKIASLPDRRYAIIVDEAHSSQSGELAVSVKQVLSESQIEAKVAEQLEEDDAVALDQVALRAAISRGKQPNLSFFAFTATPKYKTLELFGHKGPDGKPAPFHLYSMRQAIQERFILDVVQGYTTYQRYFQLVKAVADDPKLDPRKAARALARYVNLHPTNIGQKVEIIVEHFRTSVRPLLGGRAKAMVVTGSRLEAVRYKQRFEEYLREKGYTGVSCLVAFSGEVKDPDLPGLTYTEPAMNGGISETELPARFAGPEFNVLIVANKYQTGFDQPLLCAMYVDRRLAGIQAVQTLSRLNRVHPGKTGTFVLDFFNERDEILRAFQDFYEEARTADQVDPQRLYELKNELDKVHVYEPSEVDNFAQVFFKLAGDQGLSDHPRLNAWLDPAVDRFKALPQEQQEEFRGRLSAFRNLYGFLSQVAPFADADLEKLYAFSRMLARKLPRESGGPLDLDDEVALKSFILKRTGEGDLGLQPGQGQLLKGPTDLGTGKELSPEERLSTIVQLLNARFGTRFDAQDLVEGVARQLIADEQVQQAAIANDKANFGFIFEPKLTDALLDRHARHAEFIDKVFADESVGRLFRALMLDHVYAHSRGAQRGGERSAPLLGEIRRIWGPGSVAEQLVGALASRAREGEDLTVEQVRDLLPGCDPLEVDRSAFWLCRGDHPMLRASFQLRVPGQPTLRLEPTQVASALESGSFIDPRTRKQIENLPEWVYVTFQAAAQGEGA